VVVDEGDDDAAFVDDDEVVVLDAGDAAVVAFRIGYLLWLVFVATGAT
jgi:hypothetical protein